MGKKNNENNATINGQQELVITTENNDVVNKSFFGGISFDDETILKEFESIETDGNGQEVVSYRMQVSTLNEEIGDIVITDKNAIIAIKGINNVQTIDKWLQYRKGAYLVQIMNSRFVDDNNITSVKRLAEIIDLGLEPSTCNGLENTARKLGITFDNNGELHLADDLPFLPFYHYSQIISLVTETDNGYDRSSLKDFITKCNITAITPQSKLKELFRKYKNGEINGSMELPQHIADKVKKDNDNKAKADAEKKRIEELRKDTTLYVQDKVDNAKTIHDKQNIALDLLSSLKTTLSNISESLYNEQLEYIVNLEMAIAEYTENNE